MRKIDEIAKTMTKEEVLKGLTGGKDYTILVVNGEEYYCPGNLGLKESDDCDCSCEECWRKALDGVKFKEKEEKVVAVAPTFEEVEKSGIKNIELVMEHRIEEAIKNGEDLMNLNCYSTESIMLNEQQIRQLIEWLPKVISYIDSVKAKDDEAVVPEEKKVLNKEELENLVGITIIEK